MPVSMQVENENNREILAVLIKTIPTREGDILKERYGLQGRVQSLSELSKKLGISKERVRQLEMRGIERLQAKYAQDCLLKPLGHLSFSFIIN
jgi:RNA polymerase sigma factor (sigma-70 family)